MILECGVASRQLPLRLFIGFIGVPKRKKRSRERSKVRQ